MFVEQEPNQEADKLLASPINIRLGWIGLSETNTLAYLTHESKKKVS